MRRGVDADLILRLWAQRIASELTQDEDGNELPVPRFCCTGQCDADVYPHHLLACLLCREMPPPEKKSVRKEDAKIYEIGKGKRPPSKQPAPRAKHEGNNALVCTVSYLLVHLRLHAGIYGKGADDDDSSDEVEEDDDLSMSTVSSDTDDDRGLSCCLLYPLRHGHRLIFFWL